MRAPSLPRAPVAAEGSAGVLKLPFQVTSVTSSLKRGGVLLLLGFFSCYKYPSPHSLNISAPVKSGMKGGNCPERLQSPRQSPAALSRKGPASTPQVWLFSDPFELLCVNEGPTFSCAAEVENTTPPLTERGQGCNKKALPSLT